MSLSSDCRAKWWKGIAIAGVAVILVLNGVVVAMAEERPCKQSISIDLTEPERGWAQLDVQYEFAGVAKHGLAFGDVTCGNRAGRLEAASVDGTAMEIGQPGSSLLLPEGKKFWLRLRREMTFVEGRTLDVEFRVPVPEGVTPEGVGDAARIEVRIPKKWAISRSFPEGFGRSVSGEQAILTQQGPAFCGTIILSLAKNEGRSDAKRLAWDIGAVAAPIVLFGAILIGVTRRKKK